MKLSRRELLQGTGLGLASLAFPSLGRAQSAGTEPLKLLFVYAEAGWTHRFLDMRPPWAPPEWSAHKFYRSSDFLKPDNVEFEFSLTDPRLQESDFSRLLKPLHRHRDQMIVTEGLALLTSAGDPYGDAHAQAHIHSWSGTPAASADGVKSRGSVPSVDQRILQHIRKTDPSHLSMDFRLVEKELFHEWLYASDGQGGAARLPVEDNPVAAYDRFFGASQPTNPFRANARLSLTKATERFTALASRMSSEDRHKLEAHRDLLQSLDTKLGRTISCDKMQRPTRDNTDRVAKFNRDLQSFSQLAIAGLSCGVSRVATLGRIQPHAEAFGLPASTDIHHEYEHTTDPHESFKEPSDLYLMREEAMVKRNELQMQSLASILDLLRGTPSSTGGTLLDSTLVVYLSEISHGNHGHEHYPTLLFGGGSTFSLGRYVKYAQNNPNPFGRNYNNEFTGTAHSRLLISILRAFGVAIDDFGVAKVRGEAPHVSKSAADVILGGPLPRLKV